MKRKSLLCAVLGLMLLLGLSGVFAGEAAAEGENIQMSVVCEPAEGGVVTLGDRAPAAADAVYVPKGSTLTLTACPAEGYRLAYWTYTPFALGEVPMGGTGSLSYTPYAPTSDTVYTAHFIPTSTKASAAFVDNTGVNAVTELDLGVETVGYTAYTSSSNIIIGARLMLKNTGDCILAPAGFRLDEEGKEYFNVNRLVLNPDTLINRSGILTSWMVYPKNGLEPGIYEGTVTFVECCQPGLSEPVSVKVKFEVTEDAVIRTKSSSEAGGTTTGDGRYKKGETVTLTADPNDHYTFKDWVKGSTHYTENPLILEADPELSGTYTANFTLCDSHVIVNCEGEGQVLLEGQPPADSYDLWIPVGESLTATAVPAEGWRLAYWKNAAGTTFYGEPGSLEYKTQGAVTAVFISRDVKTEVQLAFGAELLDLGTASEGYTAYIPNTNFTYMTVNIKQNIYVRNTGDCLIPLKNGYLTLSGKDADCFHVERQSLNRDSYLSPRGGTTGYPCRVYPENGLPEGVYEATISFVEICQGGIDPPASIPVRFEVTKAYEITAKVEGDQGGKVTGAGFCPAGEAITLTAVPDVNFAFDHWTRGDGSTVTENPLTFVPEAKETVTAHFRRTGYSVRVSADPAAGGSIVDGSGDPAVSLDNQAAGTRFTFTAIPGEGYLFGYWTDNGNVIAVDAGTEATVTVTANPDHALVAHFLKPALAMQGYTGTGVRATVTAPAGAVLAAVSYDDNGRLADLKTVTVGVSCVEKTYELALKRGTGGVRLFLLSGFGDLLPLCAATSLR